MTTTTTKKKMLSSSPKRIIEEGENNDLRRNRNLEKKADLFKAIANVKDRRYRFKTYKQCFVGRGTW